jgi:uncharacterized protein (UPF0147 family)
MPAIAGDGNTDRIVRAIEKEIDRDILYLDALHMEVTALGNQMQVLDERIKDDTIDKEQAKKVQSVMEKMQNRRRHIVVNLEPRTKKHLLMLKKILNSPEAPQLPPSASPEE